MKTLLFIYNARSGKWHTIFDTAHKLISPKTYACSLCALTHTAFKENATWKAFRTTYKVPMLFFHADEFELQYPEYSIQYPGILLREEHNLQELITKDELERIDSLASLIHIIQYKTKA